MTYKGGPDAAAVRIPRATSAFRAESDRELARISRAPSTSPRARSPRSVALAPSPSPSLTRAIPLTAPPRIPQRDAETLRRFESMNTGGNPEVAKLLQEMREHTEALAKQRKHEDPRLSFSTPEYKDFSRKFTEQFKKNFGKPIEWGLVKRYPWSVPQLEKLEHPVDPDGNPWPLDENGEPILKQ